MKLKLMVLVTGLMSLQNCASDYGYRSYGGGYYRQPNYDGAAQAGNNAAAIGAQIARCGLAGELCRQQPTFQPPAVQQHHIFIHR